MNLHYVISELYHRRRRTIVAITGLSIGIIIFLVLNSLSLAYHEAARAPLKEIAADITIQRSGNVPEELSGVVFPCSAVTIKKDESDRIAGIPGITGMGKALLVWVFDADRVMIVLGIESGNTVGPSTLKNFVADGRFFDRGKPEAVVEANYAKNTGINIGNSIQVAGRKYSVTGFIDASNAPKIAVANIYLPLEEVQALAVSSRSLQSVSPFAYGDTNLLFIKVDQRRMIPVTASLKSIMGNKTAIATPETFLKLLGNLFALSDKLTMAASLIALIITILIVFKTMAGNIAERAGEIGIMKTVGWTGHDVMSQILAESVVQCLAAGILGYLVSSAVVYALSFMTVSIPIPWEMSPVPHFLPGGGDPVFKTLKLPIHIPWTMTVFSLFLSVITGGLSGALLSRHIAEIKPSEVLRHE